MSPQSRKAPQSKSIAQFRRLVWDYYHKNGRFDLPWRQTQDPYKILVSEVMLQQTQVPRVIEKYKEFLAEFPTVLELADAPLSVVLKVWSGLGYNRRGKYLHDAARATMEQYEGNLNEALKHPLPGVGPYTRAAVRAFAFDEPAILIETNIRAVFIHHFFANAKNTDTLTFNDREILTYVEKAAEGQDPRTWNWALMDYGVHIKKLHKNPARKSAHYTKQSKFEGSLRQVRGEVIRVLAHEPKTARQLVNGKKREETEKWERALEGLAKDGLIKKEKGKWRIA